MRQKSGLLDQVKLSRNTDDADDRPSTTTGYSYSNQGSLSDLAHDLAGIGQDINYAYTRNQAQEIIHARKI